MRDVMKQRIQHDLGVGDYRPYRNGNSFMRTFHIIARERGVLCGMEYIPQILEIVENEFFLKPISFPVRVEPDHRVDGTTVLPGEIIATLVGDAEVLLKAERTILWALRELSGIATYTRKCVEAVAWTGVTLLDTRKGDALARDMHKYAVRVGGAMNHRAGFYDGIMIKDNDIAVYGSIKGAIDARIRENKFLTKIEVEVDSPKRLVEVLQDGRAEVIMLDNMAPALLKSCVDRIRKDKSRRYVIEASGIGSHSLREVAETGVDAISLSALVTRGIGNPVDISMKAAVNVVE